MLIVMEKLSGARCSVDESPFGLFHKGLLYMGNVGHTICAYRLSCKPLKTPTEMRAQAEGTVCSYESYEPPLAGFRGFCNSLG
jgi:hypothetical protein